MSAAPSDLGCTCWEVGSFRGGSAVVNTPAVRNNKEGLFWEWWDRGVGLV